MIGSQGARAGERHVPGEYATIAEAMQASGDGDEIVLAAGTYVGDGNRNLYFDGRAITIRSTDPNDPNVVDATVIDCQGEELWPHTAFIFQDGEGPDSVVAGLTITGCYGAYGGAMVCWSASPTVRDCVFVGNGGLFGGAIYNSGGSLTILRCRFTDNVGTSGGALWNSGGGTTVVDCEFVSNLAPVGGGGAMVNYDGSTTEVSNCRFTANVSTFGGAMYNHLSPVSLIDCEFEENAGGHGGAVYNLECDPSLTRCDFVNNTAFWGAGVDNYDGSRATITDCYFEGNEATWGGGMVDFGGSSSTVVRCIFRANRCVGSQGGAVCCGGDTAASVFEDCLFENNETMIGTGGGIAIRGGNQAKIRGCTITGNIAENSGGGIFVEASSPTITSCTIAGNHAASMGGGVLCYGHATTTIRNSLIAGNTSQGSGAGMLCTAESALILSNCTVADNRSASQAGGLSLIGGAADGVNSVFWGNAAPQGPQISVLDGDTPSSLGIAYSTVQGGVEDIEVDPNATVDVGQGVVDTDPLFVDAHGPDDDPNTWDDNDYHLAEASPCLNAGDPNGDHAGETDIDGQDRVFNGRVDIGADEYLPHMSCGSGEAILPLLAVFGFVGIARRRGR